MFLRFAVVSPPAALQHVFCPNLPLFRHPIPLVSSQLPWGRDTLHSQPVDGLQPVVWKSRRASSEDFHPLAVIPDGCWVDVTADGVAKEWEEARRLAQVWPRRGRRVRRLHKPKWGV